MFKRVFYFVLLCCLVSSCASYYTRNIEFNKNFESANYKKASDILLGDKKAERRKAKLLYYLNLGVTQQLLGNYTESNQNLEKAYLFVDDYRTNAALKTVSFLTNPKMEYYHGEDHEQLFINYYKALNYLYLNDKEAALVEVRRMDLRLQQIKDRYKSEAKYKEDAFIHLLMGIVYDVNNDVNNAFVAYRNAYEIYQRDYSSLFNFSAPAQLKKDILRTGTLSGMDMQQYEKEFGFRYDKSLEKDAALFCLWHNGLGPVKEEMSINFTVLKGSGGNVTFVNEELGLSFNFVTTGNQHSDLGDLRIIRVAYPKYIERKNYYSSASIGVNNKTHSFEMAEDVNKIAFLSLKQRMLKELSEALLRLAVKKGLEEAVRSQNQNAAALLSVVNAVSEQADTRNWQTLPHEIHYARVPLQEGSNELSFMQTNSSGTTETKKVDVIGAKGKNQLMIFTSNKTLP